MIRPRRPTVNMPDCGPLDRCPGSYVYCPRRGAPGGRKPSVNEPSDLRSPPALTVAARPVLGGRRRGVRALTIARVTLVMVLIGLAWRTLRYALGFPIWGDEAFVAVNFMVRDYRGMIEPLVYGQIAPLAFMWVELAARQALGVSEWALRVLPFASGLVALVLYWRFARRTVPRSAALLAIGIFAASIYIVRHSAEVKPYATDLLVSLGLTMLAWSVWQRPGAVVRWVALVVLAGAAPWCSYPSLFVGGSVGVLLTWLAIRAVGGRSGAKSATGERRNSTSAAGGRRYTAVPAGVVVGWLIYGLVFCGSAAAMYFLYAKPHADAAARVKEIPMWTLAFPPFDGVWKFLVWLVGIHTSEMFAYPHGAKPPGSIATFILAIIGAVRLWRTQRPLLLLLLGPLPLTFIAAAMHAYPYGGSARTSLYMAPAICLLAGLGLFATLQRFLRGQKLRDALLIASAALAVFAVGGMVSDVWRPYYSLASLNSREAVREVARRTGASDRWVIFNADREVPYAPYLGAWRGVGGQFVFDAVRFAPVPVVWAPPPESLTPVAGGRVWLLAYWAGGGKVTFPEEQFAAYLATATERLGEPQHDSLPVKKDGKKVERLEVYRFGR